MSGKSIAGIILSIILIWSVSVAAGVHPSFSDDIMIDTVPFYENGTYNQFIPHPNEFTQYPIGHWPLRYHELVDFIHAIAEKSDRVLLEEHEKTYEGRQLYNLIISSPEHIANIEQIKTKIGKLADPDAFTSKSELSTFVNELPAVAWLGYSIHGDEISGVDASAQLIYQLAAGTDDATMNLLNNIVIIIDPTENPDGRERYLSMLETYKSHVPNYDRYAQQHQGVWPYGRGNHYLFDLNRDWIILAHPETRGRISTILEWHPQLVVDAHEMGTNATFLFTPPRQPINYNTPASVLKWWDVFQGDQGNAFDKNGWPYYIKEWHEQWYPGYGSAWPTFFGVIGILYEQAGVDGQFVKQRNGYLLTYHESVNHHFTSSLTNLTSLAENRVEILTDYHNTRRQIVADGKKSKLQYLFAPDNDELKMKSFIESLIGQGIEVSQADESFTVSSATDIYHKEHTSKKFPAGTYIVSTAQPHGALAKAVLDFDPHLNLEFLKEERKEIEKYDETRMYEVSTWSLPLAYNLDAYQTTSSFSVTSTAVSEVSVTPGKLETPVPNFAYLIDMVGEKTYLLLNELFAEHVTVYASEKPVTVEGRNYQPGALMIRVRENRKEIPTLLQKLAKKYNINIYGVNTAIADKGSYLGAGTFRLLTQPKVAILSGAPLDYGSFGVSWFTIDRELQIPHSLINIDGLGWANLSLYNVIVVPSVWGNRLDDALGKGGKRAIEKWVHDGGTLIVMGSSASWVADTSVALSNVRLKRQVLDKLETYETSLERTIAAESPEVDTMALWHPDKVPASEEEEEVPAKMPGVEKLKEIDEWQRKFMPRGVIMKVELDTEDWLAFGLGESVPAMLYTSHAFMADDNVSITGRLATNPNELRMSGLLWPEARNRWAKTVYTTHERSGKGQIVLFATPPNTRAYFWGTRQMFVNALLYGPGMGSSFEGPYNRMDDSR